MSDANTTRKVLNDAEGRHYHTCPDCGKGWWHRWRGCGQEKERECVVCHTHRTQGMPRSAWEAKYAS